ncbi:hypothetical protein BT93_L5317 [Corymbia citriodora subsp. variegata]|uniref:25S rRNA (Uridine(2843)-N(3))-methyltransferase n=1 Tax=Corymbia citriodora subsp. variegata TaxID=360336 RepID=A0A8T0CJD7_CORYI|nr:hypothetical protein BT93_L5317 [Corymbia citriodora subsp. variegata]
MVRGNGKLAHKSKPKPTAKKPEPQNASDYIPRDVPLELQQRCLKIFRETFDPGDQDSALLQEVKGHLFLRDFAAAFGQEQYLRVYASRWSPSRALGYVQVLGDVEEHLMTGRSGDEYEQQPFRIVCLGGGAGAEVVALAGWMHLRSDKMVENVQSEFIDIAAWDSVISDLHRALTTPPELSKYASAIARQTNTAMVAQDQYAANFQQLDALQIGDDKFETLCSNAALVTLMFTLNELYSSSMPKTQQMLSKLKSSMKAGACLLVVDSPGSYSTVSINGTEKKYPMQWLLDYTLIGPQQDSSPKWQKLVSDDSRWFRLPQGLKYPIELENMRYQIHLYRRNSDEQG